MSSDPPPRMRDLARALGVSQATVSNAFSRPDQLSRELRDRILDAARELGYPGPDPIANTFRRGRTGAVGLITREPLQYLFEDAAARLTMAGIARVCGERGSSLVLVPRAEPGHPDVVPTALVDGFVAFCDPLEPERRELLRARRLPVVGLDAPVAPGEPYVGIDDRAAALAAAAHLVDRGHRRVGVISFALAQDSEPGSYHRASPRPPPTSPTGPASPAIRMASGPRWPPAVGSSWSRRVVFRRPTAPPRWHRCWRWPSRPPRSWR
ncbi:hypothetical protein GCM10027614_51140 [Micromonospora vulcania]